MEETKRIKVLVEERTTTDGTGRKFNVYKAVTKNGRLIDLKFPNSVTERPTVKSWVTFPVDAANISTRDEYPVMWIKKIVKIEPITDDDHKAENVAKLTEYFG